MPKDNRKILNSVRGSDRMLFSDGMEDELAAELSQERLDELIAEGVLAGDWKSSRGKSPLRGVLGGKTDDDFPEDFPARSKFMKLGKTYAEVKAMNFDELKDLDGIAEKTADGVLAFKE